MIVYNVVISHLSASAYPWVLDKTAALGLFGVELWNYRQGCTTLMLVCVRSTIPHSIVLERMALADIAGHWDFAFVLGSRKREKGAEIH